MFFGLGSDGTVGANKNTIKILGDEEGLHAQGYFVYDSKKSGSQTVSHLRFGPQPISAPYLVSQASFVGCHQFGMLERPEVLDRAGPGATLLLNTRHPPDEVWDTLSRPVQEQILAKRIELYVIDAGQIARDAGLAGRTNTVLQTCFFAISGVLEREQAIERIKATIAKTYGRRGAEVVERNQARASTARSTGLHRVELPERVTSDPRAGADRAGRRAGVRAHRDRGDDGRPRRRAAGQRAAGRRHLPERHDRVREAQRLRAGRGLGSGAVHPVRQLQLRLPAQRDPLPLLRRRRDLDGAPEGFRSAPLNAPGAPRHRATRCRSTSRTAPAAGCASRRARCRRAESPCTRRSTSTQREPLLAAERENIAFFERLPASRPLAGRLRHGARHAVPGAAVRVLRRVRRLRRDALPEAALAAVRRPADGRQRDRLLVDLRRQPADDAVDGRRRRARPGMVELAVRGQRRVRPRAAARRRPPHRARPPPARGAARRRWGPSWSTRSSSAPQLRESELRAQRERIAELERRLDGLRRLRRPPTCAACSIT